MNEIVEKCPISQCWRILKTVLDPERYVYVFKNFSPDRCLPVWKVWWRFVSNLRIVVLRQTKVKTDKLATVGQNVTSLAEVKEGKYKE